MDSEITENDDNDNCNICYGGKRKEVRIHNGIPMCRACESFWQKMTSSSQVMICSNNCQGRTVRSCRYCRLQRCFDIGLTKEDLHSMEDVTLTREVANINARECPVCLLKLKRNSGTRHDAYKSSGVLVCRSCHGFFRHRFDRFKTNTLMVMPCAHKHEKCDVRDKSRSDCAYCTLKKCFEVGMKCENFNSMQNVPLAEVEASCSVCCTILDLKKTGDSSTAYGPRVCNQCKNFFDWRFDRFKKNQLTVDPCTARSEHCIVGERCQHTCTYCTLKKCFDAGMKRNDFDGMEKVAVNSNQSCSVCLMDLTIGPKFSSFNALACRGCYQFFKHRYNRFVSNELTVMPCMMKKSWICKIGARCQYECAYCTLKKCFEAGMKRNDFDSIQKVRVAEIEADCSVCSTALDLTKTHGSSTAFGARVCMPCDQFFRWRYTKFKDKALDIFPCAKDCTVGERCAYCTLKKCFEAGMKRDDFDGMEKVNSNFLPALQQAQSPKRDMNQNMAVMVPRTRSYKRKSIDSIRECPKLSKREFAETKPEPNEIFVDDEEALAISSSGLDDVETDAKNDKVLQLTFGDIVFDDTVDLSCKVCGNPDAQDNSGVVSCNSCFFVFKHVQEGSLKLKQCPKDENCDITWKSDNRPCRFCRVKKCIRIAIEKGTVGIMINGHACTISQIDIIMSSLLNETEVEADSDLDEALAEDVNVEELEIEFKKKRLAIATTIAQEKGKFMCPDCLIVFDSARMLFDHVRQPHNINKRRYSHLASDFFYEVSDEESDESEEELEKKSMLTTNKEECNQCGFVLTSYTHHTSLYYHNRNWHLNGSLECSVCDAVFLEEWQLAFHLEANHRVKTVTECHLCFKSHPFFKTTTYGVGRFHGSNESRMAEQTKRQKLKAFAKIRKAYPQGATHDQSMTIMLKYWPHITGDQVSQLLNEFNLFT